MSAFNRTKAMGLALLLVFGSICESTDSYDAAMADTTMIDNSDQQYSDVTMEDSSVSQPSVDYSASVPSRKRSLAQSDSYSVPVSPKKRIFPRNQDVTSSFGRKNFNSVMSQLRNTVATPEYLDGLLGEFFRRINTIGSAYNQNDPDSQSKALSDCKDIVNDLVDSIHRAVVRGSGYNQTVKEGLFKLVLSLPTEWAAYLQQSNELFAKVVDLQELANNSIFNLLPPGKYQRAMMNMGGGQISDTLMAPVSLNQPSQPDMPTGEDFNQVAPVSTIQEMPRKARQQVVQSQPQSVQSDITPSVDQSVSFDQAIVPIVQPAVQVAPSRSASNVLLDTRAFDNINLKLRLIKLTSGTKDGDIQSVAQDLKNMVISYQATENVDPIIATQLMAAAKTMIDKMSWGIVDILWKKASYVAVAQTLNALRNSPLFYSSLSDAEKMTITGSLKIAEDKGNVSVATHRAWITNIAVQINNEINNDVSCKGTYRDGLVALTNQFTQFNSDLIDPEFFDQVVKLIQQAKERMAWTIFNPVGWKEPYLYIALSALFKAIEKYGDFLNKLTTPGLPIDQNFVKTYGMKAEAKALKP